MYSQATCLKYQIYMTDLGYDVKYEPKKVYHNNFQVNKWFDAWENFRIDTFIPGGFDSVFLKL